MVALFLSVVLLLLVVYVHWKSDEPASIYMMTDLSDQLHGLTLAKIAEDEFEEYLNGYRMKRENGRWVLKHRDGSTKTTSLTDATRPDLALWDNFIILPAKE